MDAIRAPSCRERLQVDLETANYYSDHGMRLSEALEFARTARADRPGIYGDDARSGLGARAERPLRGGAAALGAGAASRDAGREPLLPPGDDRPLPRRQEGSARDWFAQALDINPHFSLLWAPVAKEAISKEARS